MTPIEKARAVQVANRAEMQRAIQDRVASRPPITSFLAYCPHCGSRVPLTAQRCKDTSGLRFFCTQRCKDEMRLIAAEIEIYALGECVVCHRNFSWKDGSRGRSKTCGRVRCKRKVMITSREAGMAAGRKSRAAMLERKRKQRLDPKWIDENKVRLAAIADRKKKLRSRKERRARQKLIGQRRAEKNRIAKEKAKHKKYQDQLAARIAKEQADRDRVAAWNESERLRKEAKADLIKKLEMALHEHRIRHGQQS